MKKLMIAFVAIATLTACSNDDDNNEPAFLLSNTNLAGSHDLTFVRVDAEIRGEFAGVSQTALVNGNGDTFQTVVDFAANGTFLIDGQFRIVTDITLGGDTTSSNVIVDIDSETGNYSIGSNADTITFNGIQPVPFNDNINIDLINGTWDVTLFNENELRLTKTESEVDGDTETDTTVEIRFMRQ